MVGEIKIQVWAEWREVEPDGQPCAMCGDDCYLGKMTPICVIGKKAYNLNTPLCMACSRVMKVEQLVKVRWNGSERYDATSLDGEIPE